ncbi:MAG: putative transporter permease protein [Gemmatimonadetes bacterium]|jgi:putative ABC transport system permease protein|nr:putative transporter permease protein [Gemmatimonadota bacterium]
MPFIEAIRLALQQIWVQKLKSFFTLLGVMIGVTFLIAVVSIVGGMSRYMSEQLVGKIMAVNSFELRRRPNIQLGEWSEERDRELRRRPRIKESDIGPVAEALPEGVLWSATGSDNLSAESKYVGKPKLVYASTVTEDYFTIKRLAPVTGRIFSPQEYERGANVIVIGQDVANYFYPGLDPLGRELVVRGLPYTVVGLMEKQGSAFGISFDKFIIAPHKSPMNRYVNPHGVIDAVMIQTPSREGLLDAQERVRQVMRARHHLRPSQKDDFELETSDSALAFWNKIKGYLVIAGVALPAIGLVVGAIVIMNIMLVAVAERTREIGIRKSLGARRRDIMSQFLVESATLSTVGAALGVATGFAFAKIISIVSPLPAAVELWSVVLGITIGAGVGIIAGVYPASQASRLDPITALRAE